ncbi:MULTISPECIES: cysteine hydrolase family protein [Microbulbifer]|uniref:cysteine hydrolase family protein n=1 Tax=Microbulbifer TaxID=48073 RepID=UPI001E5E151D|nr:MULTISPECIES: isochorismatase family cysteine hydrolase [Microbulbifer]UHQ55757.1 cysteine hydrolase [Microbulbifer sp. YPW16]
MKAALLCIDLQYLVAARGHGIFSADSEAPFDQPGQEYYFDRLEKLALPNIQELQAIFRDKGLEVIHLRTRCKTTDGRDRTYWHKRRELLCLPGSRESEFLDSVRPRENELIINKTGSGPFGNSNIHPLLTELDISQPYCCGVFTHQGVESTVRALADFHYRPVLVTDATATGSEQVEKDTVDRLQGVYCDVIETETLVEDLRQHIRSVR